MLRLDEMDPTMLPISSTIVPGTDDPADADARVLRVESVVARDGRVHLIELTERSGPVRSTTVHSVDLETGAWTQREVPQELAPIVVPEGDDLISAVAHTPGDWHLVRWNEDRVLVDQPFAGVSASFVGLVLGGDGFLYVVEDVGDVTRLHAVDPVDLTSIRELDVPFETLGVRVDSDASAVFRDWGYDRLMRWTTVGATTRSRAEIPWGASLQAIGRSGEILVADRDGWVAIFSRNLTLSAEHSLPTEPWTPRMAWAWADPAAR